MGNINAHREEPIRSVDFFEMACGSVNDPVAACLFSQVVGTVRE